LLRAAVASAPQLEYPRRVFAERLVDRGRFAEAFEILQPCGTAYTPVYYRVRALIGLDRFEDAEVAIAAFEDRYRVVGRECVGALMLKYRVARRRWDWQAALALSEIISRENNERDDDGRLDHWEQEKFECLCRLGEAERALRFGERQAVDAPSLARLAYEALGADCVDLARELSRRALRMDPDETQALHVAARLAELDGNAHEAIRLWRRVGVLDPVWHVVHEHIARVSLGMGDLSRAKEESEAAIDEGGHMCPWAFGVRAQARLLHDDRDGAAADLARAWALALPENREHEGHDVWALRARLGGDGAEAERLLKIYLREGAAISAADRARVGRVVEAGGR
jgi:tetratricopeptide (TPR) repeat protein